jgi:hypothetical protein
MEVFHTEIRDQNSMRVFITLRSECLSHFAACDQNIDLRAGSITVLASRQAGRLGGRPKSRQAEKTSACYLRGLALYFVPKLSHTCARHADLAVGTSDLEKVRPPSKFPKYSSKITIFSGLEVIL